MLLPTLHYGTTIFITQFKGESLEKKHQYSISVERSTRAFHSPLVYITLKMVPAVPSALQTIYNLT